VAGLCFFELCFLGWLKRTPSSRKMNGVLVGMPRGQQEGKRSRGKWRSSSEAGRVELDYEGRGGAGGQGESCLTEPDGGHGVVGGADGEDLLTLQGLVGGEEDRPRAAQPVRAGAAQLQRDAVGLTLRLMY